MVGDGTSFSERGGPTDIRVGGQKVLVVGENRSGWRMQSSAIAPSFLQKRRGD